MATRKPKKPMKPVPVDKKPESPLDDLKKNQKGVVVLAVFLAMFFLTGCGHKPIQISTAAVDVPRPMTKAILPAPDAIKTYPASWVVINYGTPPAPVFCLSAKGYENLARSQADTLRWIKEAAGHLRYYQKPDTP